MVVVVVVIMVVIVIMIVVVIVVRGEREILQIGQPDPLVGNWSCQIILGQIKRCKIF
jgi:hypothetical protein